MGDSSNCQLCQAVRPGFGGDARGSFQVSLEVVHQGLLQFLADLVDQAPNPMGMLP